MLDNIPKVGVSYWFINLGNHMREEDMLDLREGLSVIVSPAAGLSETPIFAKVRGIATNPLPVIGRSVIVEPEFLRGKFSCHSVFELHLIPV